MQIRKSAGILWGQRFPFSRMLPRGPTACLPQLSDPVIRGCQMLEWQLSRFVTAPGKLDCA